AGLDSDTGGRRVSQVIISAPSATGEISIPLCEKGTAERAAAINALPLTDVIGPLMDHQAAASLKESIAKEASDAVAATTSGSNVPKRGRKFSSVRGTRRKAKNSTDSDASPPP
ncbi:Os12g0186600, partial [Oryza sativa Japonica Group]